MSRVLIRGIFSHRLFILSFQTFRISKFASALAFSLTTESLWSSVRAESAMQPTGGIFTNVDSVSKLNPHVVVDYVSSCSDLSSVILPDTAFPEHSECLFESFVSIQFPGQVFGDRCSSPDVDIEEIKANLFAAVGQCQDFDELGFIDTAARIVQAIFADESCWEELCEEDSGVLLHIESQFLDSVPTLTSLTLTTLEACLPVLKRMPKDRFSRACCDTSWRLLRSSLGLILLLLYHASLLDTMQLQQSVQVLSHNQPTISAPTMRKHLVS
jgi:hypothetical protein